VLLDEFALEFGKYGEDAERKASGSGRGVAGHTLEAENLAVNSDPEQSGHHPERAIRIETGRAEFTIGKSEASTCCCHPSRILRAAALFLQALYCCVGKTQTSSVFEPVSVILDQFAQRHTII